ncbi:MAG: glycosyltransferase family A protein [Gemmatimonadales bacterium]
MSDVTVLIPTRALPERASLLRRAIASVLDQEEVTGIPLVIVNGDETDPAVLRELETSIQLTLVRRTKSGLAGALHAGEQQAVTTYITALDDDDILLPGALAMRVQRLARDPGLDAVITNGLRRNAEGDALHVTDMATVRADPVGSMIRSNWLLPGAWLARRQAVSGQLFAEMPKGLECTYLGLRLVTGFRVAFLDEPTVVWHTDAPRNLHGSREFLLAQADGLAALDRLALPPAVRSTLRRRRTDALHWGADLLLREGDRRSAWSWHLRSLAGPGGWRYAPFTVRLLLPVRVSRAAS